MAKVSTSITIHAPASRFTPRAPRVADAHLARVLAGQDTLLIDGAMGTQLQARGLGAGELPELLCLTHPEQIRDIHAAYVEAGAEVITTNTFGANARKLANKGSVAEIFSAAIGCARAAGARYVAADIGPTGALLRPLGTMSFDECYDLFVPQVQAADAAGADLFIIETMADLAETKAAILACREHSDLPIFCTMTFGEDGRTFLGTTPEVTAITLPALGVDVVGINCSLGPAEVAPLAARMVPYAHCPVMVQANAGLPQVKDGKTIYTISPEEYVSAIPAMLDAGITILGGCCGTTPEYTRQEAALLARRTVQKKTSEQVDATCLASAQRSFVLGAHEVGVIGERINPTGKKRLKQALVAQDLDYVMGEAIAQERAGAEVLDVNVGLPELDEPALMARVVGELQSVTTLPLQIDSADPVAIEAAVRSYPGKPIINSCNGTAESLASIVPIAAHYGCALVGLTLDEAGIPHDAQARLEVARRIVSTCEAHGMDRSDILIDCLAMAASTDQRAPATLLQAIRLVKRELPGVRCVLGVSNISFGLPYRQLINATFLAAAFAAGLDFAIINPLAPRLMDAVDAWRVLSGQDTGAAHYIAVNAERTDKAPTMSASAALSSDTTSGAKKSHAAEAQQVSSDVVVQGVLEGRAEQVRQGITERLDAGADPLALIDKVLIYALDEVGKRFEQGTFFLPQLMASAEAAKAGFEVIRTRATSAEVANKGAVAICTVKGDVHDIGKNIVKMLLENYGYAVRDLGRDCDPQVFCDCVVREHIELAGLSALMTTTVPAMAETIELLRAQAPWCKVMVGGAVLNPEYAQMVGADFYAKDASEAARIAGEVLG